MKSFLVTLLSALALLTLATDADACNRCGRFRGCSYCNYVAVAPVYKIQQPSVFVVQNNGIPAPIATQGQSIYGYNAAVAAYSVNPAEVLHQASLLATAANQTAITGINGFNSTAQLQLGLQAQLAEPLIKSNAATQVLTAAGLNQAVVQKEQTLALRITYGPDGQPIVRAVSAQEVNAASGRTVAVGNPQTQPPPQNQVSGSILHEKCARCHGVELSAPKAGIYFDAGQQLSCDAAFDALQAIAEDRMPKGGPVLTNQEKAQAMQELMSLRIKRQPTDPPPEPAPGQ